MGGNKSKVQKKPSQDKVNLPTQSQINLDASGVSQSRVAKQNTSIAEKSNSNKNINNLYLSRLGGQIPENQKQERLRSSKMKQNVVKKDKGQSNVKVNDHTVTVKEEKPHQNSKMNANGIPDFESDELIGKKIKKFTITAIINEKDLVKQSNYFDESHEGDNNVKPTIDKNMVNFKLGQFDQFHTSPIKTYLFDRTLAHKIRS